MRIIEKGLCTANTQAFRKLIEPPNCKTKNQKTTLAVKVPLNVNSLIQCAYDHYQKESL